MILMKDEYRIQKKTHTYWIDNLTVIWDNFLLAEKMDTNGRLENVLFRYFDRLENYAFLIQIVERIRLRTTSYEYSMPTLILAVMYLLIRLKMEGDKDGMMIYRNKLEKSSNFLFVDKAGVNQIFSEFLAKLGVDMSEVLSCCQFVGGDLNPDILIIYPYAQVTQSEYALSYHFHNEKLAS